MTNEESSRQDKDLITVDYLRTVIGRYYYKGNEELMRKDGVYERKLIITPIGGQYGSLSCVILTLTGSPPRGNMILFPANCLEEIYSNTVILFANGRKTTTQTLIGQKPKLIPDDMITCKIRLLDIRPHIL